MSSYPHPWQYTLNGLQLHERVWVLWDGPEPESRSLEKVFTPTAVRYWGPGLIIAWCEIEPAPRPEIS